MAYAVREDMRAFGLPESVLARMDPSDIEKALEAASSEADVELERFLTLPLVSWPRVLTQKVCAIAAFELMTSFGYSPQGGGIDTKIEDRAKEARAWLQRLGALKGAVDSNAQPAPSGPVSIYTLPMRGWQP